MLENSDADKDLTLETPDADSDFSLEIPDADSSLKPCVNYVSCNLRVFYLSVCVPEQSCPFLHRNQLYKNEQVFFNIQYRSIRTKVDYC